MATYTPEQKKQYAQQKRDEQKQLLTQAIENLCSSEGWKRYLDARSRFHKYSFNNTILIALQRPEATQVAGAGKWRKEFNRLVIEGERSIKIFGPPMPIHAKDEKGNVLTGDDGKPIVKAVWYKTLPVFDVSQTDGDPLPEPEAEDIHGHTHDEYLARCEQYAEFLGRGVKYVPLETESAFVGGEYHINYDLEINGRVRALVRQLAEVQATIAGMGSEYSSSELNVIVESVAYLTCANIGLDTSGMSVPYIAKWGEGKDAILALREFAGRIDEITGTLTEAIS